jgi:RanBP-type and C3HC4-type zinc finger-containing protein 1
VEAKYNFPVGIQRWIIGKRCAKPNESLSDCGIRTNGHTVYLYLTSDSSSIDREQAGAWGERRDAGLNRANSVADVVVQDRQRNEAPNIIRNDPRSLPNMPSERVREVPQPVVGWECPICTFVNSPSRPGCEMCSTDRPQDYQIPDGYVPDERERERLERAQVGDQLLLQVR